MINAPALAETISARFLLDITAEPEPGGCNLRVGGIASPNGFTVAIRFGWRSAEAVFIPDSFAAGLLRTLCQDVPKARAEFLSLNSVFAGTGIRCTLRIDDAAPSPEALPAGEWKKFELSCSRLTDRQDDQSDAVAVGSSCLALLLSLLTLEDAAPESSSSTAGLPEGAMIRVEVNRYERSHANRAAAIAAHGSCCHICDFDFARFYGPLGEGFIEVHHRTPVSRLGAGYIINPLTDLIPLCANCHQMVHRHDPPKAPEELRAELLARGVIVPKAVE